MTFSIKSYKNIKEKSLGNLTDTEKGFFHLLSEFEKLKKQQKQTTDMCAIFQFYFYKNLFDPVIDSKIIDDKLLTKKR